MPDKTYDSAYCENGLLKELLSKVYQSEVEPEAALFYIYEYSEKLLHEGNAGKVYPFCQEAYEGLADFLSDRENVYFLINKGNFAHRAMSKVPLTQQVQLLVAAISDWHDAMMLVERSGLRDWERDEIGENRARRLVDALSILLRSATRLCLDIKSFNELHECLLDITPCLPQDKRLVIMLALLAMLASTIAIKLQDMDQSERIRYAAASADIYRGAIERANDLCIEQPSTMKETLSSGINDMHGEIPRLYSESLRKAATLFATGDPVLAIQEVKDTGNALIDCSGEEMCSRFCVAITDELILGGACRNDRELMSLIECIADIEIRCVAVTKDSHNSLALDAAKKVASERSRGTIQPLDGLEFFEAAVNGLSRQWDGMRLEPVASRTLGDFAKSILNEITPLQLDVFFRSLRFYKDSLELTIKRNELRDTQQPRSRVIELVQSFTERIDDLNDSDYPASEIHQVLTQVQEIINDELLPLFNDGNGAFLYMELGNLFSASIDKVETSAQNSVSISALSAFKEALKLQLSQPTQLTSCDNVIEKILKADCATIDELEQINNTTSGILAKAADDRTKVLTFYNLGIITLNAMKGVKPNSRMGVLLLVLGYCIRGLELAISMNYQQKPRDVEFLLNAIIRGAIGPFVPSYNGYAVDPSALGELDMAVTNIVDLWGAASTTDDGRVVELLQYTGYIYNNSIKYVEQEGVTTAFLKSVKSLLSAVKHPRCMCYEDKSKLKHDIHDYYYKFSRRKTNYYASSAEIQYLYALTHDVFEYFEDEDDSREYQIMRSYAQIIQRIAKRKGRPEQQKLLGDAIGICEDALVLETDYERRFSLYGKIEELHRQIALSIARAMGRYSINQGNQEEDRGRAKFTDAVKANEIRREKASGNKDTIDCWLGLHLILSDKAQSGLYPGEDFAKEQLDALEKAEGVMDSILFGEQKDSENYDKYDPGIIDEVMNGSEELKEDKEWVWGKLSFFLSNLAQTYKYIGENMMAAQLYRFANDCEYKANPKRAGMYLTNLAYVFENIDRWSAMKYRERAILDIEKIQSYGGQDVQERKSIEAVYRFSKLLHEFCADERAIYYLDVAEKLIDGLDRQEGSANRLRSKIRGLRTALGEPASDDDAGGQLQSEGATRAEITDGSLLDEDTAPVEDDSGDEDVENIDVLIHKLQADFRGQDTWGVVKNLRRISGYMAQIAYGNVRAEGEGSRFEVLRELLMEVDRWPPLGRECRGWPDGIKELPDDLETDENSLRVSVYCLLLAIEFSHNRHRGYMPDIIYSLYPRVLKLAELSEGNELDHFATVLLKEAFNTSIGLGAWGKAVDSALKLSHRVEVEKEKAKEIIWKGICQMRKGMEWLSAGKDKLVALQRFEGRMVELASRLQEVGGDDRQVFEAIDLCKGHIVMELPELDDLNLEAIYLNFRLDNDPENENLRARIHEVHGKIEGIYRRNKLYGFYLEYEDALESIDGSCKAELSEK
ncbi:MAG: hypothetical protein KJ907_10845 [Actinobacteria bacterium]|nr:hypothetical protein [Actinomycetota bacterium]MBU4403213.1 hypothetical protein [Actinomycetota bacterium]